MLLTVLKGLGIFLLCIVALALLKHLLRTLTSLLYRLNWWLTSILLLLMLVAVVALLVIGGAALLPVVIIGGIIWLLIKLFSKDDGTPKDDEPEEVTRIRKT